MMKLICFFSIVLFSITTNVCKAGTLPVKSWKGSDKAPFILYISGDGGLNSFTNNLCDTINKSGYAITAINSKSYFWDKKTPELVATEISAYIESVFKGRENQQLVIVGYSFGADVTPFIINRLSATVKKHLVSTVLVAPSATTDFVIRLADMWGTPKKRGMDVAAELNRAGEQKIIIILPEDDQDFPVQSVKLRNFKVNILKGGHHFSGNAGVLAKMIMAYFK